MATLKRLIYTTGTLMKNMKKRLDVKYLEILCVVVNKS